VHAVHFAATLTAAGAAFFVVFIAEPVLEPLGAGALLRRVTSRRLAWLVWIGVALTLLSGAAWFVLLAQSISDEPLAEMFSRDTLWTLLVDTGFGHAWMMRLLLACLLAGLLAVRPAGKQDRARWMSLAIVVAGGGLTGTLAWAGHGVGGAGPAAPSHPAADFLHLVAAAAWVRGLLRLAFLLAAAGRASSVAVARAASLRFSAYGMAAVGVLLLTGATNTWYLAGSIRALTATDYGHLLLVKITLFLVMLALATTNRLWLTPALAADAGEEPARHALRQLRRNVVIEIAAGAVILAVVAVLGPPLAPTTLS
jgi:copper resistance protein D